ncbi:MAG: GspH/FimT family pseudopilin [Granulosicoccaceae bacterium]
MRKSKLHQSGFTFIELLVTLVIAGTLVAIGLPSFGSLMERTKLTNTTNDYIYSLHKARSEAVKRVMGAGLCPSTNSMAVNAACDDGSPYSSGWLVYADEDNSGVFNAGEEILHRIESRANGFTFTSPDVFVNQVYFDGLGNSVNVADVPVSGTINITYAGGSLGRNVIVSANGRVISEEQ